MQGVDSKLMSGVADQVKPFTGIISTSGAVLQQHTEVVKTETETLIEQDKILKKTTFNMSQFKDELKSGGSKFNDGIKELTGGLVDIGGLTETVGKKFKAIGDIGRGIASPVTGLFSSFSRQQVDADGKPIGDDKKPGLEDLVDEKDLEKKKKLDKDNLKQTDQQNKNLKKNDKGFKKLLVGMTLASLKFIAIGAVVALAVVGFLKLISALSDNGGLQSVFDFISNMMGRIRNAFNAVILGLDTAVSKIPGVDGFLGSERRAELEQQQRDNTSDRAFRKQRADDSKEVKKIREKYEAEGKTGSALDAAVDTEAMEKGLITNRMVLADEQDRAAGKKGILIKVGGEYVSAGQASNDAFISQLAKESGDDEYMEDLIDDNALDPERAKQEAERRKAEQKELIKALAYVDSEEMARLDRLIADREAKKEARIKNVFMDRGGLTREEAEAAFQAEVDTGKGFAFDIQQDLDFKRSQKEVVQATIDNFKAVTGDDAATVLENMKMGQGTDGYGEGDNRYSIFGAKRFEKEFNEYALQNENVRTIDYDQAALYDSRLISRSTMARNDARRLQEMREANLSEEQLAEFALANPNYNTIVNTINETSNLSSNNAKTETVNMDLPK